MKGYLIDIVGDLFPLLPLCSSHLVEMVADDAAIHLAIIIPEVARIVVHIMRHLLLLLLRGRAIFTKELMLFAIHAIVVRAAVSSHRKGYRRRDGLR